MKKKIFFKKANQKPQVRVISQDLSCEQPVDVTATKVMECLKKKVSPELHDVIGGLLLGFHEDMQLEIAADLLEFACDNVIHTTGCPTADIMLATCYRMIADEKGIKLIFKFAQA